VTVTVRDEHGQTSASPQLLTYLDIGSNAITSTSPSSLQGIGGQTITVTGEDFSADSVLTPAGAPIAATLVDATTMTFVAPAHTGGAFELKVQDQYEQSDTLDLAIGAFTDDTDSIIPTPNTGTGVADSWRATHILKGDVTGDGVVDLVIQRRRPPTGAAVSASWPATARAGSPMRPPGFPE